MKVPKKEEIKRKRLSAGLTQQEAADLVHVSRDAWCRWEGGSRPVNLTAWELFLIKNDLR